MEDLRTILSSHNSKNGTSSSNAMNSTGDETKASTSEIPDLFFDQVLVKFKMTRIEILMLMYLYRITWCRPNLYKKYGIAPMIFHQEVAELLDINMDILHQTLTKLENFAFIETIRSGQYFVRKYFTEENDRKYGQTYDNFL